MRIELAALAFASGCVSTSIASDLDAVRALTSQDLPDDVLDAVDPALDESIERALEEPLTADAAVRISLANNRELRASLRELGIERGRLLQARLFPNPEVEFDLRYQEDRLQPIQAELFVEYALTEALLLPMRAEAAARDLDEARYRAAQDVLEAAYRARASYYAVQAAEQRAAIAMRALDALAAARDAAMMLYESGNATELDVAAQIAAYEEARADTAELELDRASARERLNRVLGVHGRATQWTVEAELESVPAEADLPENIERTAIGASVELAAMRMHLEAIAQRLGLSQTEGWLPDIHVDAHAEQDGNTWEIGGGARITVPLFDHNEGTSAAYEAEFDAAMERYVGAAIDIRSEAREAHNRLQSAHRRALQYQNVIVPARNRVYEQTLLQYNAMQLGIFELIAAVRARLGAEIAAVDSLAEYWTARAALDVLARGTRVSNEDVRASSFSVGESSPGGH
jgi:outer membrane protein, heavy metal efflux system